MRRHRVKEEAAETSKNNRGLDPNPNLLNLVNDRVELMQQVFSCLRTRDLQAVMPESLKHLPMDNIKELCLEELLGISSKRLTAVLSGTSPPSDTESSSEEQRPPVSLDSISSDEGALNNAGETKKKRRKHKESKKRSKKKESSKGRKGRAESHEAERGGLTVLELLELQARARAIRAQLLAEPQPPIKDTANATAVLELSGDEDDVMIKEEPPEVVELSSDDEKPNVAALKEALKEVSKPVKDKEGEDAKERASNTTETSDSSTVTKINDLTIIVPKVKTSKKIKLKRDKFAPKHTEKENSDATIAKNEPDEPKLDETERASIRPNAGLPAKIAEAPATITEPKPTKKPNSKKKKKIRTKSKVLINKSPDRDDSDKDEIMLQLSDSEKMDVLEDFYQKKEEKQLSSRSEDSESSTSEDEPNSNDLQSKTNPSVEYQESNNEEERKRPSDFVVSINVSNTNEEQFDDIKETLVDEINNRNAEKCDDKEATQPQATHVVDDMNCTNVGLRENKAAYTAKEKNVANEKNNTPVSITDDKCDEITKKYSLIEIQELQIQKETGQPLTHCEAQTENINRINVVLEDGHNIQNSETLKVDSDLSVTKPDVKPDVASVTDEVDESNDTNNDDPKTDLTELSSETTKDIQSPSQQKVSKKKKTKKSKKAKKSKKKC